MLVRRAALRYGWVARPMEDRWDRRVVARLGGVAMLAVMVCGSRLRLPDMLKDHQIAEEPSDKNHRQVQTGV